MKKRTDPTEQMVVSEEEKTYQIDDRVSKSGTNSTEGIFDALIVNEMT